MPDLVGLLEAATLRARLAAHQLAQQQQAQQLPTLKRSETERALPLPAAPAWLTAKQCYTRMGRSRSWFARPRNEGRFRLA